MKKDKHQKTLEHLILRHDGRCRNIGDSEVAFTKKRRRHDFRGIKLFGVSGWGGPSVMFKKFTAAGHM